MVTIHTVEGAVIVSPTSGEFYLSGNKINHYVDGDQRVYAFRTDQEAADVLFHIRSQANSCQECASLRHMMHRIASRTKFYTPKASTAETAAWIEERIERYLREIEECEEASKRLDQQLKETKAALSKFQLVYGEDVQDFNPTSVAEAKRDLETAAAQIVTLTRKVNRRTALSLVCFAVGAAFASIVTLIFV